MKKRNKGSNKKQRREYAENMYNSRLERNLSPHKKSKDYKKYKELIDAGYTHDLAVLFFKYKIAA